MKPLPKTILWLTVFSIAMGFLETAVVVYLREIYYPEGFAFPLRPIEPHLALTEFLREAATLIMLLGIGVLAGKNSSQRMAGFLFCFAIWDLTYYLFLKILLDWPASLFTWDILFLIPVPWVGPVLAPCLVALCMIWLALLLWHSKSKAGRLPAHTTDWGLLIVGCSLILITFMQDYITQAITKSNYWSPGSSKNMFSEIAAYVPLEFNWPLYLLGLGLIILSLSLITQRVINTQIKKIKNETKGKKKEFKQTILY